MGLLGDVVTEYAQGYIERRENPQTYTGMVTFFPQLDALVRGMRRKEVTFLYGHSGTGKSAFALRTVAQNFWQGKVHSEGDQRQAVLYVSAEMDKQMVVERIVCTLTGIDGIRLQTGEMEEGMKVWLEQRGQARYRGVLPDGAVVTPAWVDNEVQAVLDDMQDWNLVVLDSSAPTTMMIEREIKRLMREGFDVPLVVVDHMGNVADAPPVDGQAAVHQSKLNAIKGMAKAYNTHMLIIHDIVTSALRRDTRPRMTDLKGGAGSNFDPDNVLGLYSEELAEARQDEVAVSLDSYHVQVFVDKNRRGGRVGHGGTYHFAQPAGYWAVDYNHRRWAEWVQAYRDFETPYFAPVIEDETTEGKDNDEEWEDW